MKRISTSVLLLVLSLVSVVSIAQAAPMGVVCRNPHGQAAIFHMVPKILLEVGSPELIEREFDLAFEAAQQKRILRAEGLGCRIEVLPLPSMTNGAVEITGDFSNQVLPEGKGTLGYIPNNN